MCSEEEKRPERFAVDSREKGVQESSASVGRRCSAYVWGGVQLLMSSEAAKVGREGDLKRLKDKG